jgi:hypothetical protein
MVIGSREDRRRASDRGRHELPVQRTQETRLQCKEPGRLKEHRQEGEQPNAKQHHGELHGVIS